MITILLGLALATSSPKDIENRLLPPVQLEGRAAVKFRLVDRMKYHRVPAVSVAVIKAGKLEWATAWGTLEAGGTRKADANTMFQAASITNSLPHWPLCTWHRMRISLWMTTSTQHSRRGKCPRSIFRVK